MTPNDDPKVGFDPRLKPSQLLDGSKHHHSSRATICPFRCPLTVLESIRPKPDVGTPAALRVCV